MWTDDVVEAAALASMLRSYARESSASDAFAPQLRAALDSATWATIGRTSEACGIQTPSP